MTSRVFLALLSILLAFSSLPYSARSESRGPSLRIGPDRLVPPSRPDEIAVHPGSELVAAFSRSARSLEIWNLSSGAKVWSATNARLSVLSLGFSTDGNALFVATRGQMHVVDYRSGTPSTRYPLDPARPRFSPSGQHYAIRIGAAVKLVDLNDGKTIWSKEFRPHGVIDFNFDAGGRYVAVLVKDVGIQLIDMEGRESTKRITMADFESIALSSGAGIAVAADDKGDLQVYDLDTCRWLRRIIADADTVELSADGEWIVARLARDSLGVWSASTGRLVGKVDLTRPDVPFQISNKRVVLGDTPIQAYSPTLNKITSDSPAGVGAIRKLDFLGSGDRFVVKAADPRLRIFSSNTGEKLRTINAPSDEFIATGRADEFVFAMKQGIVRVDGARDRVIHELGMPKPKTEIRWPSRGVPEFPRISSFPRPNAFLTWGDGFQIWDFPHPSAPRKMVEWSAGRDIYCIQSSPDGKNISLIRSPEAIEIYSMHPSGIVDIRQRIHDKRINPTAAHMLWMDANRLMLRQTGVWYLVDIEKGSLVQFAETHFRSPVAFSKDGAYVFGLDTLGSYSLWEVATQRPAFRIDESSAGTVSLRLTACAVSPDLQFAATGHSNATVYLWALNPDSNREAPSVDVEQFESWWRALRSLDATIAYRAICDIAKYKVAAPRFLQKRVSTARLAPQRLSELMQKLNSFDASQRQRAFAELQSSIHLIQPSDLHNIARSSASAQEQIETLRKEVGLNDVRNRRAIHTLERIGGDPAKKALETIAHSTEFQNVRFWAEAALIRLNQ